MTDAKSRLFQTMVGKQCADELRIPPNLELDHNFEGMNRDQRRRLKAWRKQRAKLQAGGSRSSTTS